LTAQTNFCDDVIFIYQLKEGASRNLYSDGMMVDEMRDALQDTYNLDDTIVDRIEFILGDFFVKFHHRRGRGTVEVDYNCDSAYMMQAMDRVGESIRRAYHWIPRTEKCYQSTSLSIKFPCYLMSQ